MEHDEKKQQQPKDQKDVIKQWQDAHWARAKTALVSQASRSKLFAEQEQETSGDMANVKEEAHQDVREDKQVLNEEDKDEKIGEQSVSKR